MKLKIGDNILYQEKIWEIIWIDDTSVTDLIGIKDFEGNLSTISFKEMSITKTIEE